MNEQALFAVAAFAAVVGTAAVSFAFGYWFCDIGHDGDGDIAA